MSGQVWPWFFIHNDPTQKKLDPKLENRKNSMIQHAIEAWTKDFDLEIFFCPKCSIRYRLEKAKGICPNGILLLVSIQ